METATAKGSLTTQTANLSTKASGKMESAMVKESLTTKTVI
jgi:hypothetical protein